MINFLISSLNVTVGVLIADVIWEFCEKFITKN